MQYKRIIILLAVTLIGLAASFILVTAFASAQTDNPEIQQVYNNLLRGSQNHLRAFAKTLLTQTGETYQPQYLSLEEYQAIISQSLNGGSIGRGGQGGRGGLGRGGSMQ